MLEPYTLLSRMHLLHLSLSQAAGPLLAGWPQPALSHIRAGFENQSGIRIGEKGRTHRARWVQVSKGRRCGRGGQGAGAGAAGRTVLTPGWLLKLEPALPVGGI